MQSSLASAARKSDVQCISSKVTSGLGRKREPKIIQLFVGDKRVANYNTLIKSARPGDDLQFGNGETFRIVREIGKDRNGKNKGGTTKIFDIGNNQALRVPIFDTKHSNDDVFPFIEDFRKMQTELRANGVPVVEMDVKKSVPGQAIVVHLEPFQFTLEDYLNRVDEDGKKLDLSKKQKKEIENKLIQFARTTWMYEHIGDFRPTEIGYNGKEWVLFDFGDGGALGHDPIKNLKSDKTTFSYFYQAAQEVPVPKSNYRDPTNRKIMLQRQQEEYDYAQREIALYPKMIEAILKERKKQRKDPSLFKKIKKRGFYSRDSDEDSE